MFFYKFMLGNTILCSKYQKIMLFWINYSILGAKILEINIFFVYIVGRTYKEFFYAVVFCSTKFQVDTGFKT